MNFRALFQISELRLQFLLLYFSSIIWLNDFNHVDSVFLPLGKNAILGNMEEDVGPREMYPLNHVVQQVEPFLSHSRSLGFKGNRNIAVFIQKRDRQLPRSPVGLAMHFAVPLDKLQSSIRTGEDDQETGRQSREKTEQVTSSPGLFPRLQK